MIDAGITPHLALMTEFGTRFRNAAHAGSPHPAVCAPSRAMLHTGRHYLRLPNSLVRPTDERDTQQPPLLGELLQKAGYRCVGIGKWHNGKAAYAKSFDDGGPIMFGGMSDHDAVPVQDFDPSGEYHAERTYTADGFSSDLFADAAVNIIREHHKTGDSRPLFLYVAFTAPHDPRTPPPPWDMRYPSEDVLLPPSYMPEHPFDNGALDIRDERLEAIPRMPEAIRRHWSDYFGMLSHMDACIGRIHEAVREADMGEDTLVIHTADHGLSLGDHGLMGKQNLYEESLKVPLLMVGPGVPRLENVEAMVYQHSLCATLLEAAGVDPPPGQDFGSLWPLLRGESDTIEQHMFSGYARVQRSVRDRQWKLIEYHVGENTFGQLFNMENDPEEFHNLITTPACRPVVDRLRAALRERLDESGDPFADAMHPPLTPPPSP